MGFNPPPALSFFAVDHLLHGPGRAAAEPGLSLGLDRSPDALHAIRLALVEPLHGILPPDWDGAIRLERRAVLGDLEPDLAWKIDIARLRACGQRLPASVAPSG